MPWSLGRRLGLLLLLVTSAACVSAPREVLAPGLNACSPPDAAETRQMATTHLTRGPHGRQDVQFAMSRNVDMFLPCVQAFARETPRRHSTLLRVEVAPSGQPTACVAENDAESEAYLDCLVGAVQAMAFRAVDGDAITSVFSHRIHAVDGVARGAPIVAMRASAFRHP